MNTPSGPLCLCPEHLTGKHCQRGKRTCFPARGLLEPWRFSTAPLASFRPQRNALNPSFSSSSMSMRHGLELDQQMWPGASAKVLRLTAGLWPVRVSGGVGAVGRRAAGRGPLVEGWVVCYT